MQKKTQKIVIRVIAVVLVLLMCLTLLPIASWAEGVVVVTHEHENWSDWTTTVNPTCSTTGTRTRSCLEEGCTVTETETIAATGAHNFVEDAEPSDYYLKSAATCTSPAVYYYRCSVCGAKSPENMTYTRGVALGHNFVEDAEPSDYYLKSAATCTSPAEYYMRCSVCGARGPENVTYQRGGLADHDWQTVNAVSGTCTQAGTAAYQVCSICGAKDPADAPVSTGFGSHSFGTNGLCQSCGAACIHSFGADDICTSCGMHQYGFTVTIAGNGSATWNGNAVTSGQTVKVPDGTQVTVALTPAANNHIRQVSMNGEGNIPRDSITFPVNAANAGMQIVLTFAPNTEQKTSVTPITASATVATAISSEIANIAASHKTDVNNVRMSVFDVTPYWGNDTGDLVSSDYITAPISFQIPYPAGLDVSKYDLYLYHINAAGVAEPVQFTRGASGLIASSGSFSPMVLVYVLSSAVDVSTTTNPDGSTVVVITDKDSSSSTTPAANTSIPPAAAVDRIDDGKTQDGQILYVNNTMEYWREGTPAGYTKITGNALTGLPAGRYYVRYSATPTTAASTAKIVTIADWYTVTAKHLYGKGTYYTDRPTYNNDSNVYLVPKGESITFHFTPDNHYWLYAIYVNDQYVGQKNVKTTFTLSDVRQKCVVSFGFSSSSSSPKTADDSNITLYAVTALVAAAGMTGACVTLFRKKKNRG